MCLFLFLQLLLHWHWLGHINSQELSYRLILVIIFIVTIIIALVIVATYRNRQFRPKKSELVGVPNSDKKGRNWGNMGI